ncbi:hypothetical protein ACFC06_20050 [Nocardia sp. NPDC056064]|uniref:hypothetical protein n=1 Tax=Nocardia sp. NPDC056064 TaxID=3345701 RepID=UPI0035E3709C
MGAVKTLDDINAALADFSKQVQEVRDSPSDVDSAFRAGQAAMVASQVLLNPNGIGTAVAMQKDKDKVKEKIKELLTELQGAIDALQAPLALLSASTEWLAVQTQVNEARNWILNKADLRGKWTGGAAEEYFAKLQLQITATDTASAICEAVSNQLGTVSDAAWEFYSKVATDLVAFFTDFAAALTKISTGISTPIGIGDAIDALVSIINKVMEYGVVLGGVLMTQAHAINSIDSSVDNPRSFHQNKWPEIGAAKDLSIDAPDNERWAAR